MRHRPLLHTSYAQDVALVRSTTQRYLVVFGLVLALALPWLLQDDVLQLLGLACVTAVGALGLNIVTGLAGQVSLGHAFFLAIGAYTAAAVAGDPHGRTIGLGVTDVLVFLPAAGIVAALAGVLVAPLATRLRGLYLAVVTLGLVFVGGHVFNEWPALTGGPGIGRQPPAPTLLGYDLNSSDAFFTRDQKLYVLMLVLLLVAALAARNLARSRVGRALTAIRDRDVAAGVIGVNLARYKTIAFGVSSFYAGCAGALLYVGAGYFDPSSFDLLLSVQYIAMILIGGAGTVSGAVLGAFLVTLLPRLTREAPSFLPFISTSPAESPNAYQLETMLYGVLIIVFLIFEPRGLFGVWLRLRNYWKTWPFSY